jgi:transposase
MLYNEADFVNVKSTLELACDAYSIRILFLPKFHCELNFIEQCWGHAKRIYRQKPPLSSEGDLEKNLIDALDSVTVEQM